MGDGEGYFTTSARPPPFTSILPFPRFRNACSACTFQPLDPCRIRALVRASVLINRPALRHKSPDSMLQFPPVTSPKMDMPTLLALHAGFALIGSAQINLVSFHPLFLLTCALIVQQFVPLPCLWTWLFYRGCKYPCHSMVLLSSTSARHCTGRRAVLFYTN